MRNSVFWEANLIFSKINKYSFAKWRTSYGVTVIVKILADIVEVQQGPQTRVCSSRLTQLSGFLKPRMSVCHRLLAQLLTVQIGRGWGFWFPPPYIWQKISSSMMHPHPYAPESWYGFHNCDKISFQSWPTIFFSIHRRVCGILAPFQLPTHDSPRYCWVSNPPSLLFPNSVLTSFPKHTQNIIPIHYIHPHKEYLTLKGHMLSWYHTQNIF